MQLKAESNEDHRKRYHMINKLRKAESYVLRLDELCSQVKCDARTKLEVQVSEEFFVTPLLITVRHHTVTSVSELGELY